MGYKVTETGQQQYTRSFLVDALIVCFAISSWVGINGLWVELPVLVQELPESWNLASYIVITSQLANLGPVLFTIIRRFWSQKEIEVPAIHVTLAIGTLSCILLIFFWNEKTFVGEHFHSTALLILTFSLAFVDCTSSVLYLPFMANFQQVYVISYVVGEGMSSLVPSTVALIQGVGGNPECRNVSLTNVTEFGNFTEYVLTEYHRPPRFSVSVFLVILSGIMIISWIAFLLLNILPQAKSERITVSSSKHSPHNNVGESFMTSGPQDRSSSTDDSYLTNSLLLYKGKKNETRRYYTLLGIQAYICTLHNVLLSIQTYSCLPYGNVPYHLTVSLSSIANPLLCMTAMVFPVNSLFAVIGLAAFCSYWAAYIIVTAVFSPAPPLVGHTLGAVLVVCSWILVIGTMAFIKARIAAILRAEKSYSALFWCGVVTQVGSATGALIMFGLVNFADIFHSYKPCRS